ncbi:MAG: sensor histidine kinase [Bacteroidota bacterium]
MTRSSTPRLPVPIRFLLGVLVIVLLSLFIFSLLMNPPLAELGLMALFLGITALVSSLVGYAAYRLGWLARSPALRWTLLGGYALASLLTFFNVWFSAQLMFASPHDLLLAIVLLIFAGGMATALGYFLSNTVAERISLLRDAAAEVAEGRLGTRVPVSGRDEVAGLAATFNSMAARLETADREKRQLEQARADLIAWVGHDLQTPLASIRAILEALHDGVVDDPQTISRYLGTAQRDVQALSALIEDLFQMAQLDAGGLQLDRADASLADLLSDTLESFSELAARQGVTLEGDAGPGIDPVFMDTPRIGRVLDNLVSNALRHTPAGGTVHVSARRVDPCVEVSVRDTGEGIRPEDLPHIFDRFYRGEKSRSRFTGGTGLGLTIARSIVEAHGGEMRVESASGRGASFTFTLPRTGVS